MNLVQFILATFISYLGTWSGFALTKITPEEIKPGKKYFQIIQRITIILFAIYVALDLFPANILIAFLLTALAMKDKLHINFKNNIPLYVLMGAGLAFNHTIIAAALVFFYFLPTAALNNKKELVIALAVPLTAILFRIIF